MLVVALILMVIIAIDTSIASKGPEEYLLVENWGLERSGNREFSGLYSVAFDSSRNTYITDSNNHGVQKFSSDGKFVMKWGSEGYGVSQFILPLGIDLDSPKSVYVADQGASALMKFSNHGSYIYSMVISGGTMEDHLSISEDIKLDKSPSPIAYF
jgi:tripartite motif-containing protein 71